MLYHLSHQGSPGENKALINGINTLDIINRKMRCEEVETRADVLFELGTSLVAQTVKNPCANSGDWGLIPA